MYFVVLFFRYEVFGTAPPKCQGSLPHPDSGKIVLSIFLQDKNRCKKEKKERKKKNMLEL